MNRFAMHNPEEYERMDDYADEMRARVDNERKRQKEEGPKQCVICGDPVPPEGIVHCRRCTLSLAEDRENRR